MSVAYRPRTPRNAAPADGVPYHRIMNPPISPRDSDRPIRFYAVSFHPGLRRTADYQVTSRRRPARRDYLS